ncbi:MULTISPECIES: SH3 domain-containing protein [unclassified Crossiella]|uniref:SH3 domain-containing protein n=1 Tax=unclassified Crossiella TaxID=2620835 RepID=UPI001FFFD73E|nr:MULTISPECIES: SH3 domain-containing protein [unclassified Crossiella]MCK2238275.1 SH3 domain-containing protein [Crossiella sp. S99.2]MCK2256315.1 SH3 domain-containing protein [Crossiella sp. S99.1]
MSAEEAAVFMIRPVLLAGAAAAGLFVLSFGSNAQGDKPGEAPADGKPRCEFHVQADLLNVRSGPGTAHKVVARLRKDAQTGGHGETKDGFRKLADDRWVAAEFLKPDSRNTCQ